MAGISEGIFSPVYTDQISDETIAKVDAAIEAVKAGEIDFEAMYK
jgi:basic membrane protein A